MSANPLQDGDPRGAELFEERQVWFGCDAMLEARIDEIATLAFGAGRRVGADGIESETEKGTGLLSGAAKPQGDRLGNHQTSRLVLGWTAP